MIVPKRQLLVQKSVMLRHRQHRPLESSLRGLGSMLTATKRKILLERKILKNWTSHQVKMLMSSKMARAR